MFSGFFSPVGDYVKFKYLRPSSSERPPRFSLMWTPQGYNSESARKSFSFIFYFFYEVRQDLSLDQFMSRQVRKLAQ